MMLGTGGCKTEILGLGSASMCLPSVFRMSPQVTRSPRPPPSIFAILQKFEVGTTWEQG